LDGENYEDVIRKAIYLGGDADTQAAIAGSIAEAFYEVPNHVFQCVNEYVDKPLFDIVNEFNKFCNE
jgi:ADP-ribosylglycohydrolase